MLKIKYLFRFIIPIIIAIAFINGNEKVESTFSMDYTIEPTAKPTAYYSDFSESNFVLCHTPLQSPNLIRGQNTLTRKTYTHNTNFKHLKADKLENIGLKKFIKRKSLFVHSSFIKPFHRLISLGKLII